MIKKYSLCSEEKGQWKGCFAFISTNLIHVGTTLLEKLIWMKASPASYNEDLTPDVGLYFPTLLNTPKPNV